MSALHQCTVLLLAVVTAHTVFARTPGISQAVTKAQDASGRVVVDDPRPVAAAVQELEHRCHCVVTYEDPTWSQSQVEETPGLSRDGRHVQVPRGRPMTVTLSIEINPAVTGEVHAALAEVFRAADHAGNPSAFQVISTQGAFHVVPLEQALFDTRITLPSRTESLAEALPRILAEAGAASGRRILLGMAPVNLLMQTTTDAHADGERFGEVLERVLASTGRMMSWRLLHDFGMKSYYLNIHSVQ
jgi:hypothetical protein